MLEPKTRPNHATGAPADHEIDAAMDRYASGDDRAFAIVHAGLHQRLRFFLTRLCRVPALADDLLQESFLRIHRARGGFTAGSRVIPWAYAIARNAHTDHTRSAHVRHTRSLDEGDDEDSPRARLAAGPDSSAEEVSIARETARTVEDVLARLSPAQREAFVLIRYEGMSVSDTARILGTTENAVKLRAFHAYEAIRGALGIEKERKEKASR